MADDDVLKQRAPALHALLTPRERWGGLPGSCHSCPFARETDTGRPADPHRPRSAYQCELLDLPNVHAATPPCERRDWQARAQIELAAFLEQAPVGLRPGPPLAGENGT